MQVLMEKCSQFRKIITQHRATLRLVLQNSGRCSEGTNLNSRWKRFCLLLQDLQVCSDHLHTTSLKSSSSSSPSTSIKLSQINQILKNNMLHIWVWIFSGLCVYVRLWVKWLSSSVVLLHLHLGVGVIDQLHLTLNLDSASWGSDANTLFKSFWWKFTQSNQRCSELISCKLE